MKINCKRNSGITLVALVITIIIIIIVASISAYEGRKIIITSKIQTEETNMLTIEAKAKAYGEEIESKVWAFDDTEKDEKRATEFSNKGMEEVNDVRNEVLSDVSSDITTNYVAYSVTSEALSNMGLSEINSENYIVIFSKNDYKLMDVINSKGINYNNKKHYTLSSLKKSLEEE